MNAPPAVPVNRAAGPGRRLVSDERREALMNMERIALVTGGTRGIGRAIAARLLESGCLVAVTGTSAASAAEAARGLAREKGQAESRVLGIACDVRDAAAAATAVSDVVDAFGGLDVLVNNAGVGVGGPVADMVPDEWRRIVDTNLTGAFNMCHAAIPHLKARGGGWVINISSLSSTQPFAGGAAYAASKAGLNAFSDALMQELRHEGIRVSLVLPGSVATGFSGRDAEAGADWRLHAEDVADVVGHLVSHEARSLPSRVEIRPSQPKRK